MNTIQPSSNEWIQSVIKRGSTDEQILQELKVAGLNELQSNEILLAFKKNKQSIRQRNGFLLLAAGAFACFISCVMTMLHFFPALNGFFLYGMTSFGVVVIFAGLIMVFE